jgi:hypothetical protein
MLSASVDTTLSGGTWYLRVLSKGNTFAPDFATLGSYTINASVSSITLPLHKLELKASAETSTHKLDWEIVADENIVDQTVEVSTDGARYQFLASVPASARYYVYKPTKAAHLYYRLRVTFDNGRTYYSNIATLRKTGASAKPYLVQNLISGSLTINSPSPFGYTIFDRTGRQVAKGQLTQGVNTIMAPSMARGLYFIHFANNLEQYTDKFMKE